jgi:ketosteroid isomerase-like protein
MDALRELYDPNIVVRYAEDWPEGSEPTIGREAVVRQWEQQREAFDADTLEPIDFIDAGDRVVVRQIWRAVGRGPDLNIEVSTVTTLRKGKTILLEFFWDHAAALEAVGLAEQTRPQENVEIVRRAQQAFNRRDLQTLAELTDEDLEFDSVLTAVDAGGSTYRGPETWARYFARMDETWEDWQVEEFRVFDAGGDRLAATCRLVGTGKSSGASVEREIGLAYRLRDGKVWRLRSYLDPLEALEAVGLSEQDARADS